MVIFVKQCFSILLRQDTDDDVHAFIPMTSRFEKLKTPHLHQSLNGTMPFGPGVGGRGVNESMLALSFLWIIGHHSVGSICSNRQ